MAAWRGHPWGMEIGAPPCDVGSQWNPLSLAASGTREPREPTSVASSTRYRILDRRLPWVVTPCLEANRGYVDRALCRPRRAQGHRRGLRPATRPQGPAPSRAAPIRDHYPTAPGAARLVGRGGRPTGWHGGHRGLLEAHLLRVGRRHGVLAPQCPPHAQRARP